MTAPRLRRLRSGVVAVVRLRDEVLDEARRRIDEGGPARYPTAHRVGFMLGRAVRWVRAEVGSARNMPTRLRLARLGAVIGYQDARLAYWTGQLARTHALLADRASDRPRTANCWCGDPGCPGDPPTPPPL